MKYCAHCGALMASESNVCQNCGGVVLNAPNNQGENSLSITTSNVQIPLEAISQIPVQPATVTMEVNKTISVAPQPINQVPSVVNSVDTPLVETYADSQTMTPSMNENINQFQPIPNMVPIAPTPQVMENATPVVELPSPVVAQQPVVSFQQTNVDVPQQNMITTNQVESAAQVQMQSEVSTAPTTINENSVAPVLEQPMPAEEIINTAQITESTPVTLEPALDNESAVVSTPDSLLREVVNKHNDKKGNKHKKESLSPEEKEKNFGRITTIIIIIISVISVVIVSIFMYKIIKENDICETSGSLITTQYNYEGFDFFIPEGVIASVEDNEFILRDKENTWSAVITINDGSYNALVSNKSQISSYFETLEYSGTVAEEKEVSGTSFVTTEVFMGSKNVLIAYAKASGTKIYGVVYQNKLGTYDNYSLNIVGEVLASAIYSGYDSAMPAGFTIDMFEQTFDVAK